MKTIKVLDRQNIFDVAMQEYGSAEGVFWLLEDNPGLTIDSVIRGGDTLKIREDAIDKNVNRIYESNDTEVATVNEEIEAQLLPHGYMLNGTGGYVLNGAGGRINNN